MTGFFTRFNRSTSLDRPRRPRTGSLRGRGVIVLCAAALLSPALVGAAPDDDAPVADAAMRGDHDNVRAMLRAGVDVNAAQSDGMTALHWAAENGARDLAAMLVYAGANVEATTRIGSYTPLHLAVRAGHAELVTTLLEAGADVEAATTTGGARALHFAAAGGASEALEVLLDHGADVNATESAWGQTPLMFAAAYDRLEALSRLLERGADLTIATKVVDVVERDKADRAARTLRRQTDEAIRKLTEPEAEETETAEAEEGEEAEKPEEGEEGEEGESPPEGEPAEEGEEPAESEESEEVEGLAQPEAAAEENEDETSEASGAAVSEEGEQPDEVDEPEQLDQADESEEDAATPEGEDAAAEGEEDDATPEGEAAAKGGEGEEGEASEDEDKKPEAPARPPSFAELVGAHGGLTALLYTAREGHTEAVVALLDSGADINGVSTGDQTSPLLISIINGHFDLSMLLLELGADPNLASDNGATPLYAALNTHWAPKAGYPQQNAYKQQKTGYLELAEVVLQAGADPNARLERHLWHGSYNFDHLLDTTGATPFWRAAYATDVPAMRLLMAHGADPDIPTKKLPTRRRGARNPGDGDEQKDSSGIPPVAVGGQAVFPLHAAAGAGYGERFSANSHRHAPDGWLPSVKYLVEELGADVNLRDDKAFTPLHHAAARGDVQMVLYLVSKGADVRALSRKGQTTADMANGPVQRVRPFPVAMALLEGLRSKNNNNCLSC